MGIMNQNPMTSATYMGYDISLLERAQSYLKRVHNLLADDREKEWFIGIGCGCAGCLGMDMSELNSEKMKTHLRTKYHASTVLETKRIDLARLFNTSEEYTIETLRANTPVIKPVDSPFPVTDRPEPVEGWRGYNIALSYIELSASIKGAHGYTWETNKLRALCEKSPYVSNEDE